MIVNPDHTYYIEEGFRQQKRGRMNEIYDSFWEREVNWVRANGGTREDGEDVFQLAMKVMTHKSQDHEFILPCPFKDYLHGVCRNLWRKELIKRGKKRLAEQIWTSYKNENPDLAKEVEQAEIEFRCNEIKEKAFQEISESCRQLLTWVFEGKKAAEIVTILKEEPNVIYQRIHRCKANWLEKLRKYSYHENCKNLKS